MKKVIRNSIMSLTLGVSLLAMTSAPVQVQAGTDEMLLASLKSEHVPAMQLHSIQVEEDECVLDVFAALFLNKLNETHAAEVAATIAALPAPTPTPTPEPAAAPPAPKKAKQPAKKAPVKVASAKNSSSMFVSTPNGDKKYKKKITVRATAYSASPKENGKWGAVDYFGNPLRLGTIAVDPRIIPMGSTVYIQGYNSNGLPSKGMIAKAPDQGSGVSGNRIDIFIPGSSSIAKKFGFQSVEVYIL